MSLRTLLAYSRVIEAKGCVSFHLCKRLQKRILEIIKLAVSPIYLAFMSTYHQFAEFFLLYGEGLIERPWVGNPDSIFFVYNSYCRKKGHVCFESKEGFLTRLHEFNGIVNNALEFRKTYRHPGIELTYINRLKIEMFHEQVSDHALQPSVDFVPSKPRKLEERLKRVLTGLGATVRGRLLIDGGALELRRLLSKPTACEVLATERAKQLTVKKAFYEACDDESHGEILAQLCFNTRNFGLRVLDLPSNTKIRKIVNTNRAQLSKTVYNCQRQKVHYLPLISSSTDVSLGNCSYLDTCHKLKSCRYLHYYTLNSQQLENDVAPGKLAELAIDYTIGEPGIILPELPPQWINCDVRQIPFPILGKFAAIISDPAWDIHMSLPYGTCKDGELLSLPMHELQDEGILLLWVTGRSIEIGRKALAQWGYTISDEMIWVKLNQLRRTIVTGRTGHWLNHSKENLIVGVKGNPKWLNRKIDLDSIVSGTRETSRKPDELYDIVERLVGKHARKLEIFGRDHNIRSGWFSMCFTSYSYKLILT